MSLLNLSSLREVFAASAKKASQKNTPQKLSRKLAMDSLEDRILLSVTPNTPTDILVNTEYSENQTTEANGNIVAVDADGDFVAVWTRGDNIYRNTANRNVGWYDQDGQLHLFTDRNYIDGFYVNDLGQQINVDLEAYVDPKTGESVIDYNIYGRYFTDEVQRVTLDESKIADGDMLYSLKFQTGDTYVQTLKFDLMNTTHTSSELGTQLNIQSGHTAVYDISFQDRTATFVFDDVDDGITLTENGRIAMDLEEIVTGIRNAKNIQTALEGIFGEGNVTVTAVTNTEFQIEYNVKNLEAAYPNADFAQLFACSADMRYAGTYERLGTYLPGAVAELVRKPETYEVFVAYKEKTDRYGNVIGYDGIDVAKTAEAISDMFAMVQTDRVQGATFFDPSNLYSIEIGPATEIEEVRQPNYEISVVPVYGLGENFIGFDITYINSSGKQDMPELILTEMNTVTEANFERDPDELGNAKTNLLDANAKAGHVVTLKQNSTEFRVNPLKDDTFNNKSKLYTATTQENASVAMDADGDFAITWTSDVLQTQNPGSKTDIYARMFSASMYKIYTGMEDGVHKYELLNDGKGVKVTSDALKVNSGDTDPQQDSSIAMDADGNFTVVWSGKSQTLSYLNGIFMQRYDSNGNRIGDEIRVDIEETGEANRPVVAMSPDGRQIVVGWDWTTAGDESVLHPNEGSLVGGVYYRLYGYSTDDTNATTFSALTDPSQVGTGRNASVTFNKIGQFAVGWINDAGTDAAGQTAYMSLVSQFKWNYEGTALDAGELQELRTAYRVNSGSFDSESVVHWSTAAGSTISSNIAMDADGDFLVSYEGSGIQAIQNFDPTTLIPYISNMINENANADLLEFFDPEQMAESFTLLSGGIYEDENRATYGSQLAWAPQPPSFELPRDTYIANADVNSAIELILTRSEKLGATTEQLTRLSLILHKYFDLAKGEGDGIGFTMFDAAAEFNSDYGQSSILSSDNIAVGTRDGDNAKYYVMFDRSTLTDGVVDEMFEDTNVWQTITLTVTWNGQDYNLTVPLADCYYWSPDERYTLNHAKAALAIENTIQEAFGGRNTGWGQNFRYEGCVEVRALSSDEASEALDALRFFDDTQFDLNGNENLQLGFGYQALMGSDSLNTEFSADIACFEIQFTGIMHDARVGLLSLDGGQVKLPAIQHITSVSGMYGRIGVNDNGTDKVSDTILNREYTLEELARIIATELDRLGYGEPDVRVSIVDVDEEGEPLEEPYIQIYFGGAFAGRDISVFIDHKKPETQKNGQTETDPYPDWDVHPLIINARMAQTGVTVDKYPVDILRFSTGTSGTKQAFSGVGMEPDGDFTFVWTTFNQTEAWEDMENREIASQSIFFRTFNEAMDAAGPEAVEVYNSDGQKIKNGGQIIDSASEEAANAIIVTFTEEMMDNLRVTGTISGAANSANIIYSVTNPGNWELLKDGVSVPNAIQDIYFGMNASADPMIQDMGIVAIAENKWEAVIILNPEANLEGGSYQLVLKNSTHDINGNALGKDGTNTDGANWEMDFDIVAGTSDTDVMTPETVDPNDPNSDIVLDDQGNIVEAEGDQIFEKVDPMNPYQPPEFIPNATASDPEGDTVTVWTSDEAGNEGVFAKITYTKWENDGGRKVDNEGSWTIKVTDNATAHFASVAMDGAGDFVVTWTQNDGTDGKTNWNVWAQHFDLNGMAKGEAFCVNTTTEGAQKYSQVAMSLSGDYVITWQGENSDTHWDIYAQRFDIDDTPLGAVDEVQALNFGGRWEGSFSLTYTDRDGRQHQTEDIIYAGNTFSVVDDIQNALNSMNVEGIQFSVVATSASQILITIQVTDESDRDVTLMRLDSVRTSEEGEIDLSLITNGRGGEFMVNETTANNQMYASIDMDYEGNFVISWTGAGADGDEAYETNIYARQFKSNAELGFAANNTQAIIDSFKNQYITRVDGTEELVSDKSGIALIQVDVGGGSYVGTGTLLADGGNIYVLTAAHVVTGDDFLATNENTSLMFYTEAGETITAQADEIYVHEKYNSGSSLNDIAIIKLTSSLSGVVTGYEINRDMKVGVGSVYTRYGFGTYGEGTEGAVNGVDGTMHYGKNKWEYTEVGLLYYDFDDGTNENNALQTEFGISSDLGLGDEETCGAHGDSGGPCFIGDLITGICHGGTSDTSVYGTVGIDTQVAYFAAWIDGITGADQEVVVGATGTEFLVNDITAGKQKWSSVALDSDGDFVITWTSGDDSRNDVYARCYTSAAAPVANSFIVNTTTDNSQQFSKVSMDADGDFVIVWESYQEHQDGSMHGDADSWGVYAQRYVANDKMADLTFIGPNGESGGEFQVNTETMYDQRLPNVAMTATGDFVVTWQGDESGDSGIYTRFYRQSDDDAGPVVVRVRGSIIPEGETEEQMVLLRDGVVLEEPLQYIDLIFDEQLMGQFPNETGTDSILTVSNIGLTCNGVNISTEVIDHIEQIGFDKSSEKYVGSDENHIEKTIFRIIFKEGADLKDGKYKLIVRDNVEDRFGNGLDGNMDGVPGGNFDLEFVISSEPVDEGSQVKPEIPVDSEESDLDQVTNSSTAGDQTEPAVAMNDQGDYVVVWVSEVVETLIGEDENGDGTDDGTTDDTTDDTTGEDGEDDDEPVIKKIVKKVIMGQRYDRYGTALGPEFYVSDFVDGIQTDPDVAMDSFGNFVVSWTVSGRDQNHDSINDNNELAEYDIYVRVFDVYGNAVTNSFRVQQDYLNKTETEAEKRGIQKESSIAFSPDGEEFVITWTNINSHESVDVSGVVGQRFTYKGAKVGGRFIVNETIPYEQGMSDVTMDADHNIYVTWQSSSSSKTGLDIYVRKFDRNNTPVSGEVLVNTTTSDDQKAPSIAANDEGSFVVAWASQDGSGYNVSFQCFDSTLNKIGSETRANTYTMFSQYQVAATISRKAENGTNFAISWSSYGQEKLSTKSWGVYMNVYDSLETRNSVTATNQEILVNAYRPWDENASAVAMDAYGNIAVAWVGPDEAKTGTMVAVKPEDTDIFNKVYIRANVPGYRPIGGIINTIPDENVSKTTVSYNSTLVNGGGTIQKGADTVTVQAAAKSTNRFVFEAGADKPKVTLNNVVLDVEGSGSNYVFDAANTLGFESTVIVEGFGGETITAENGLVVISGAGYTLTIRNASSFLFNGTNAVANVSAVSGGVVSVEGSAVTLQTEKSSCRIQGCVNITASASGSAVAKLSGTEEDEEFQVEGNQITAMSGNTQIAVTNFREVYLSSRMGDSVVFNNAGTYMIDGNYVEFISANATIYASDFADLKANAGGSANIQTEDAGCVVTAADGNLTVSGNGFTQTFTGLTSAKLTGSAADAANVTANANVTVNAGNVQSGLYTLNGFGDVTVLNAQNVDFTGTAGDDTVTAGVDHAQFSANGSEIKVESLTSLQVNASQGTDSVVLTDSAADDSFTWFKGVATLNGNVKIQGVSTLAFISANGGSDSVSITGTAGNELFTLTENAVSAVFENASIRAEGVKNVTIDGNGGEDTLTAEDTAGDDVFSIAPTSLTLSGTNNWNVSGIQNIKLYRQNGGSDAVNVSDSAGNDKVVLSPKFLTMTSADAMLSVSGFSRISVNSQYGDDTAVLYDSVKQDAAVVDEGSVSLSGTDFFNQVYGFRKVTLYSLNGGADTVSGNASIQAVDDFFAAEGSDWSVNGFGFDF
ncbi:MAG: trypsin-like serine protease [Thermoguttaceae bacterium]|nr:trypsin-like serine protease [Thermoguttaceae bacterium]